MKLAKTQTQTVRYDCRHCMIWTDSGKVCVACRNGKMPDSSQVLVLCTQDCVFFSPILGNSREATTRHAAHVLLQMESTYEQENS